MTMHLLQGSQKEAHSGPEERPRGGTLPDTGRKRRKRKKKKRFPEGNVERERSEKKEKSSHGRTKEK